MKKLFSYDISWGRGYGVEGLFIATQKEVDAIIGKTIYFGEICGKHSDIDYAFESGDIKPLWVSQTTIEDLEREVGETISGHNPLEYFEDQAYDHEEDEDE